MAKYTSRPTINQQLQTLNRSGKYIYNLLNDHKGVYNNRKGIQFILNKDGSVIVNHFIKALPLEKNFVFGLIYSSNNFNDFMHDFEFTGTIQLKTLSADRLWELYYKGKAKIGCATLVKVLHVFFFRRADNKMIVYDKHNNKYELDEILQTPQQFAAYIREQALLHESEHPVDLKREKRFRKQTSRIR